MVEKHPASRREGNVEPGARPNHGSADRLRVHAHDLFHLDRFARLAEPGAHRASWTRTNRRFRNASSTPSSRRGSTPPTMVTREEMDARMDSGKDTFALDIRPNFQQDVLAGRSPAIQLNTDATRVSQAFTGSAYVQRIVLEEVQAWLQRYRSVFKPPVDIEERVRYNANLSRRSFGAVVALIDQITLLSVLLTGAALIRERERGTVEHLLVMPVTPFQIMTSKIWSMGLVVLVASALCLIFIVEGVLGVPVNGSRSLFLCGTALHIIAATSLGMFLATFARTMPQFALLMILVLLPLQMLSGGVTPRESMPEFVQQIMIGAPTTHFVKLAQGIIYRGGALDVVWPQFLALAVIGAVLFTVALLRFRKTIGSM